MIKRIIVLLMMAFTMISISSCGGEKAATDSESKATHEETETIVEEELPVVSALYNPFPGYEDDEWREDVICGENLTWSLNEGVLTISGEGPMWDYGGMFKFNAVPWMNVRKDINKVVISEGVTSIGNYAFIYCPNLVDISIPSSVTHIQTGAFSDCTNLETINIPATVTFVGEWVFEDCPSLKNIVVDDNNKYFSSVDGVLYNKKMTKLLYYPASKDDDTFEIPDTVENIGKKAFDICQNLKTIKTSSSMKAIDTFAFAGCDSLEKIEITEGVEVLGDSGFKDCANLREVIIPASVTTIESYCFISELADSLNSLNVYYKGTEEQWNLINIMENNKNLNDAQISFNS